MQIKSLQVFLKDDANESEELGLAAKYGTQLECREGCGCSISCGLFTIARRRIYTQRICFVQFFTLGLRRYEGYIKRMVRGRFPFKYGIRHVTNVRVKAMDPSTSYGSKNTFDF